MFIYLFHFMVRICVIYCIEKTTSNHISHYPPRLKFSGGNLSSTEDEYSMPHSQIRPCIRGSKNTCIKAIAFIHFTGYQNSHSLQSIDNWDSWHAIALLLSGISDWTEYQSHGPPCCSFFIFNFVDETANNVSLLFSVVRVHSTEQNDPFVHTRRVGQRLMSCDQEFTHFDSLHQLIQ